MQTLQFAFKKPETPGFFRIGEQIHTFCQCRGLTQAQLAELAALSVPYISHIERGTKQVSLMRRLCM